MEVFEGAFDAGESPPVAAIKALTDALEKSNASTLMGVGSDIQNMAHAIAAAARDRLGVGRAIPVEAACEMFVKVLTRNSAALVAPNPSGDFGHVKKELIRRAKTFSHHQAASRERAAEFGHKFVGDGETVLVHGMSRAVVQILKTAATKGRHFEVIVTEARPDCAGYEVVRMLEQNRIPTTLIMDAAVGFVMENVDVVLVGAEAILENGGITNRVGTFPIAVMAKVTNTPVYVASESFKFSRVFPLSQKDVGDIQEQTNLLVKEYAEGKENITVKNTLTDYTPPEYITLIVTELGVLTPSGVSDELIKLYQ